MSAAVTPQKGDERAIDDDRHHEGGGPYIHQAEDAGNDGDRHVEGDMGSCIGISMRHQ